MIENTWSNAFIGIPYKEVGDGGEGEHCYSLVVTVYRDVLGVELPAYADHLDRFERREIAALIAGAKSSPLWRKVEIVQPFDVLVFQRGRFDSHIGIAVNKRQMLHIDECGPSHLARFDRVPWSSKFVYAARHISQDGAA